MLKPSIASWPLYAMTMPHSQQTARWRVSMVVPDVGSCRFAIQVDDSWHCDAQTPEMTIGGSPILPEDDVGLYGRSVTFVPESPSLPANFR